ncbi:uncharacterized protein [Asterias amurensis]|uniref:uncharacterized protein n=1 Tax=Asterias amurensis TaxID=7602 RepID=UPI003AB87EDA
MARLWCILVILVPFLGSTMVVDAQTFTVQPVDTTVKEGDASTQLICEVEGLTNDQVLSFQRGATNPVIISDAGNVRSDVLSGLGLVASDYVVLLGLGTTREFKLFIRSPVRQDSSEFKCVVCSKVGSVCDETSAFVIESQAASLTVAYPPGTSYPLCSIQSDSSSTRVNLNEDIALSCSSEIGNPAVDLEWMKDGLAVSSVINDAGDIREIKSQFTVQADDEGALFNCQMTYSGPDGFVKDCSLAALNVLSDPIIVIESPEPVMVGETAVFTCTISSRTAAIASSQWIVPEKFNDRHSTAGDSVKILTITDVEVDDHLATLTCTATDDDDQTAMASEELLIVGMTVPPVIPTGNPVTTPQTTEAPGVSGGFIVGLIAAAVVIVFLLALVAWCYQKRCHGGAAKNKQAGVTSSVQIPMNNTNQFSALPEKTPNYSAEGKDYPDDRSVNNPDVIPREKRGDVPEGVDPRKWWRDTMAPTDSDRYEDQPGYPTPTIKRMKMPFEDRSSSPYEIAQIPNGGYNVDHGYDPVEDRNQRYYDDRDVSDSGYREPRYDDYDHGGYEEPQGKEPHYESADFQNRAEDDAYDYDNDAYERSYNGLDQGKPDDQYNDNYDDQYTDQYNDQYNDQYGEPRYDDRYGDRYESYGQPDGQEGYDMPPEERDHHAEPYPHYEPDERIPDGHSSNADLRSAPYDDQYQRGYNDQPMDPYGYDLDDSRKYDYDEDLSNNQETPSYV